MVKITISSSQTVLDTCLDWLEGGESPAVSEVAQLRLLPPGPPGEGGEVGGSHQGEVGLREGEGGVALGHHAELHRPRLVDWTALLAAGQSGPRLVSQCRPPSNPSISQSFSSGK